MLKKDVKLGTEYLARINQRLCTVRLDAVNGNGWDATNLTTNRKIRLRSAAKLRCVANEQLKRVVAVLEDERREGRDIGPDAPPPASEE